jgi:hypothetical protein
VKQTKAENKHKRETSKAETTKVRNKVTAGLRITLMSEYN